MKAGLFSFHGMFGQNKLNISDVSFNNHKKYCNKYNIDYLSTNQLNKKYDLPTIVDFYKGMWMRFYIYQLLDDYDAIIWVDSDVIFTNKCSNIFQKVQLGKFGVVADYLAQKVAPNNQYFKNLYNTSYPKIYPMRNIKQYFNSGVLVVFKEHKKIFNTDLIFKLPNITPLGDQDFLNWMTSYYNFEMQYLPQQYNYSVMFQNDDNFKNANIIHCNRIGKNLQSSQQKMIDLKKYNKMYGIK